MIAWIAASAVGLGVQPVRSQPAAETAKVITGARVLDVRAGIYRDGYALLVEDGRITQTGPLRDIQAKAPTKAEIVDFGPATLVPGLIDAHAHLLASMKPRWLAGEAIIVSVAQWGLARRVLAGAWQARQMLDSGFTTVRNIGHAGINGDVALRDAIESGWVPGPRMRTAARKLTPIGGQGVALQEPGFAALVEQEFLEVSGPDQGRAAVRAVRYTGADVVKIVVDDRGLHLSGAELNAIADEAHRLDMRVAAHATTRGGIADAVAAGVDSIEHGDDADDETLRQMSAKGIFLVPTLWPEAALREVYEGTFNLSGEDKRSFDRDVRAGIDKKIELIRRARTLKVRIAAGSDMWLEYPGKTRGEATLTILTALQQAGLTPLEVVRSMTIDAADLLAWSDRVGALETGRFADAVAVDGDPLSDLSALGRVRAVIKGGVVVRR